MPADLPVTGSAVVRGVKHLGGGGRTIVVGDQGYGTGGEVDVFGKDQGDIGVGGHPGGPVSRG